MTGICDVVVRALCLGRYMRRSASGAEDGDDAESDDGDASDLGSDDEVSHLYEQYSYFAGEPGCSQLNRTTNNPLACGLQVKVAQNRRFFTPSTTPLYFLVYHGVDLQPNHPTHTHQTRE